MLGPGHAPSRRRNEADGENNGDGHGDNRQLERRRRGAHRPCWRGRTTRARLVRALSPHATLGKGMPTLLGGDQLGRTQGGNNNAYRQGTTPSAGSSWSAPDDTLIEFVARVIALAAWLPGASAGSLARRRARFAYRRREHRLAQPPGAKEMKQRSGRNPTGSPSASCWGPASPEAELLVILNAEVGGPDDADRRGRMADSCWTPPSPRACPGGGAPLQVAELVTYPLKARSLAGGDGAHRGRPCVRSRGRARAGCCCALHPTSPAGARMGSGGRLRRSGASPSPTGRPPPEHVGGVLPRCPGGAGPVHPSM
jgi:hypothetical protein